MINNKQRYIIGEDKWKNTELQTIGPDDPDYEYGAETESEGLENLLWSYRKGYRLTIPSLRRLINTYPGSIL